MTKMGKRTLIVTMPICYPSIQASWKSSQTRQFSSDLLRDYRLVKDISLLSSQDRVPEGRKTFRLEELFDDDETEQDVGTVTLTTTIHSTFVPL